MVNVGWYAELFCNITISTQLLKGCWPRIMDIISQQPFYLTECCIIVIWLSAVIYLFHARTYQVCFVILSTDFVDNPVGSTLSMSHVEESMFRHNPLASGLAQLEGSNLRSAQSSPGVHHSAMFLLTPGIFPLYSEASAL